MATLIRGAEVAAAVYEEVARDLETLKSEGKLPGLAVVLVGDDPASRAYVGMKDKKCAALGLHSIKIELDADISQQQLLAQIEELNADESIHGILLQLPLPASLDSDEAILAIDPAKDVDGLHPINLGKLAMEDPAGFAPCTPSGCQRMLSHAGIETSGKRVVIVGRSLLVGKSIALLLMAKGETANATVTVAHSRTADLAGVCREADILVAAIGRPNFITAEFVKEGATVIDVGINRVDDAEVERGYRLVGDVDFDAVEPICGAITPVPGGVGPMTIAMLMRNTVKACQQSS
ncbi:MAG: methylenetetrahydrofolate dehydrogenase (NADP+)/methenyltetrahydrofolate cyclohydrolase [Verrucomicrobiales bacterium]|jgi:methylenetetrahydrofolate dehydrogenase (NADP+)/methenyltetrahydrofolate cyclohydrolase